MSKPTSTAHAPRLQRAMEHHQAGRLQEAELLYKQILTDDPNQVDALHRLGLLAFQVKRYDAAALLLRKATAYAPQNAAIHAELAEVYRRLDRLDEAEAFCRRAAAIDPHHVNAHYNLGVILQQQRRLDDALASYQHVLTLQPAHPQALYNLGNALKTLGRRNEALAAYRQALALQPDDVETLGNLGVVLHELSEIDAAIECFRQVIRLRPDDAIAHNCLGNALRDQGHIDAAAASYRESIRINPEYALAHSNLGKAMEEKGEFSEAVACYRRAVALHPERPEPYQNLAMALERTQDKDGALLMFHEALKRGADAPLIQYHIAAITGVDVPSVAPAEHIRGLFDGLAERFDRHLVETLQYRGPELIYEALRSAAAISNPPSQRADIIDLGCGTGLCAPLFKPHSRRLVGVDLSPGMIEKARQRNLYDELLVDDILQVLQTRPASFDLAIAADVLIYFGDLAPIFTTIAQALRPGGVLAFTLELLEGDGYVLCPTRRYAHSISYLRGLASAKNFAEVSITPATLRMENRQAVPGLVIVLRKTT